jgi:hypothetical protein
MAPVMMLAGAAQWDAQGTSLFYNKNFETIQAQIEYCCFRFMCFWEKFQLFLQRVTFY